MTAVRHGWKLVRPDGRTRGDFTWPLTAGSVVESADNIQPHNESACPSRPGDGLSVGLSPRGCALAGFSSSTLLVVSWDDADTAAEDFDKVRVVGPVQVVAVVDWHRAIREGAWRLLGDRAYLSGAHLYRANLSRANLYRAHLYRANLSGANLSRADLYRANLDGANLGGAYLSGAHLYRADLSGADLYRADLDGANLYRADLSGAYLYRADLYGANLDGANLDGAYLGGAYLGEWERGPDGYARRKTEVTA